MGRGTAYSVAKLRPGDESGKELGWVGWHWEGVSSKWELPKLVR